MGVGSKVLVLCSRQDAPSFGIAEAAVGSACTEQMALPKCPVPAASSDIAGCDLRFNDAKHRKFVSRERSWDSPIARWHPPRSWPHRGREAGRQGLRFSREVEGATSSRIVTPSRLRSEQRVAPHSASVGSADGLCKKSITSVHHVRVRTIATHGVKQQRRAVSLRRYPTIDVT